jgi:hypothetical protein
MDYVFEGVNCSRTSSCFDSDQHHGQHHAQDAQQGSDHNYSQLGNRQMVSEDEPACDQQQDGPVRNVHARQQQQSSSDVAPITDQLRYLEALNRVAVQSGFRNAKEMLEMASGSRAVPMIMPVAAPIIPPIAANSPAPFNAPYGDGRDGNHSHPVCVDSPPILTGNQMRVFNVDGEGETMEVGYLPSFFDLPKKRSTIAADLIFRRIRPIDEVRFAKTITALKKGRKVVWYGHPGIGKSTEANFVLLEFLRHLGDGVAFSY